MDYNKNTVLYVSFNQDYSCFVAGTEKGFLVFNSMPFSLKFERILDGGIGMIEMLYRSSLFTLVGGGKNPKYTSNKIILWDDYQRKILNEFKFTSSVRNVKVKQDKIIAVLSQRIYVYDISTYKQIELIETIENPRGLCAISTDQNMNVIVYPFESQGKIKAKCYEKSSEVTINAHESGLSCVSVSSDGKLIATTNEKGTTVRVFYSEDGEFVEEFRRGKDKADISHISFDKENNFLAVCSDRGTCHIWSLGNTWKILNERKNLNIEKNLPVNKDSFFKFFGGIFSSDKSFAQFRFNDGKAILGFGPDDNLFIITDTGIYYIAKFDSKNGGECAIKEEHNLNK